MANNAVTTLIARKKFVKAHAQGTPVPKIVKIGWGDGGVNEDGSVKLPEATQTEVAGEFIKNDIESVEIVDDGLSILFTGSIRATDPNVANKAWSSLGLYDEEGSLIAVKNFTLKNIDEDTKIEITWKEKF